MPAATETAVGTLDLATRHRRSRPEIRVYDTQCTCFEFLAPCRPCQRRRRHYVCDKRRIQLAQACLAPHRRSKPEVYSDHGNKYILGWRCQRKRADIMHKRSNDTSTRVGRHTSYKRFHVLHEDTHTPCEARAIEVSTRSLHEFRRNPRFHICSVLYICVYRVPLPTTPCIIILRGCYRHRPPFAGFSTRQVPRWPLTCTITR